jgi:hypothetical protein
VWNPKAALAEIMSAIAALTKKVDKLMSEQSHLDADVAALTAAISAVQTELANLKAQPTQPPLDFTALDAAVGNLQGLAPAAAPADTGTSPPPTN